MSFILAAQRDKNCVESFARYREYLADSRYDFPQSAHALAVSDWYFDFNDHRCPHDAWLEKLELIEPDDNEHGEMRRLAIRIRLLGAFHDGSIELFYPRVFRYSLDGPSCVEGHGDWRYDEFRISPSGHLIHEIEWAGKPNEKEARWIIEASDVEFTWIPNEIF
jgi:hypothetical protein